MSEQRSHEQLLAEAVRVLTEAARRTITWTDRDGYRHERRADFAEFVTLAVAGAAANLGGIEEALAGRPGSWEADSVRAMLHATVGYDEAHLVEHRTEPLVIPVAVDDLLTDLDVWALYERAGDELDRRENAIWNSAEDAHPVWVDGVETDPIQSLPAEQQAVLDELDRLRAALEAQRRRDWAAYGEAFTANVLGAVAELLPGLPVPVQVEVRLDWQPDELQEVPPWGPAVAVWERARELTPLPGSGIPLKDYPLDTSLPEIERAAGRDPLSRLQREARLGERDAAGGERA
jgi:hypothetical protein